MLLAESLSKAYDTPRGPVAVLEDVSFTLEAGESLCVVGPSGSGKSTLLYLLGTLERPSSGRVSLEGRDLAQLADAELAAFRNREVGFVFQDHFLLPQLSVLENVLAPTLVGPRSDAHAERAHALLARVGLGERLLHRPRALVMKPRLLLCDEPTGNLDADSARVVADLILELHRSEPSVLVLVTHSAELAARMPLRRRMAGRRLEPL
jgi:lipoprotein-releasing system ATP-binding protein